MAQVEGSPSAVGREHTHKQIDAIGWGVLFVWIGIAVLASFGWGYGLLGVGVIILGSQAAHQLIGGRRIDVFSTIVGALFVIGGVWELFSITFGLVPALCIAAGAVLLVSAITSRPAR